MIWYNKQKFVFSHNIFSSCQIANIKSILIFCKIFFFQIKLYHKKLFYENLMVKYMIYILYLFLFLRTQFKLIMVMFPCEKSYSSKKCIDYEIYSV